MKKRLGALIMSCVLGLGMLAPLAGCASQGYTPTLKSATISTPVIKEEGVLKVGVDANNPPFAGSVSGKYVGLDVDIAAAIGDELGLKIQIVDVGSDPDKALEAGTVDIVMGIDKTDTSITCWLSDPYIQSGVAVFASSPTAALPTAAASPTIAAQSSSMSAWEVTKQFGDAALVPVSDPSTAFTDLNNGTTQYAAADALIGTYAAHSNGISASVIALMETPSGYSVGVLDANTDLKTTISDVLALLGSNGMIPLIEKKWLGTPLDLSLVPLTEGAGTTNSETGGDAATETPAPEENAEAEQPADGNDGTDGTDQNADTGDGTAEGEGGGEEAAA